MGPRRYFHRPNSAFLWVSARPQDLASSWSFLSPFLLHSSPNKPSAPGSLGIPVPGRCHAFLQVFPSLLCGQHVHLSICRVTPFSRALRSRASWLSPPLKTERIAPWCKDFYLAVFGNSVLSWMLVIFLIYLIPILLFLGAWLSPCVYPLDASLILFCLLTYLS